MQEQPSPRISWNGGSSWEYLGHTALGFIHLFIRDINNLVCPEERTARLRLSLWKTKDRRGYKWFPPTSLMDNLHGGLSTRISRISLGLHLFPSSSKRSLWDFFDGSFNFSNIFFTLIEQRTEATNCANRD